MPQLKLSILKFNFKSFGGVWRVKTQFGMEVKGQEMMRIKKHVYLTIQGGREIPRQDGVDESKIVRTPQQCDCECEKCTRMAEGACQGQLSFPAMQVTSSHVSIWFRFPAS